MESTQMYWGSAAHLPPEKRKGPSEETLKTTANAKRCPGCTLPHAPEFDAKAYHAKSPTLCTLCKLRADGEIV